MNATVFLAPNTILIIANITKMPAKKVEKTTKNAKVEKDEKPKRAPSPYIVFCTEKRPEVKAANPEASFGELGKILGSLWKNIDEKEKAVRLCYHINKKISEKMNVHLTEIHRNK